MFFQCFDNHVADVSKRTVENVGKHLFLDQVHPKPWPPDGVQPVTPAQLQSLKNLSCFRVNRRIVLGKYEGWKSASAYWRKTEEESTSV